MAIIFIESEDRFMNSVQEIGNEITAEYPHPLYELSLYDFCREVKACAEDFDVSISDPQLLAIADWTGFTAYSSEEILDCWRSIL